MQLSKQHKIIIALVLVLALTYFIFDRRSKENTASNTQDNVSTTTESNGITVDAEGSGGYTIKKISETIIPAKKVQMPDLNRPVTFLASLSIDENAKKIITEKILGLQAELKKDPTSFRNWLDLGMYQKMSGDYIGASISWKFIADSSTNDFISYGNLGDLYAYYLKDGAMAEVYYKKAIANAPKQVYLYVQLSDVYKNVMNDLDRAIKILEEGLKNIPEDKTLSEMLSNLK